MSEHDEQVALFQWAQMQAGKYPELDLIYAVPNGGKRHLHTAVKLKREGVKAGVPDIFLPVARAQYHGLYIEMKFGKNKLSEQQAWWKVKLQEQGYMCWVSYSFEDAKDIILAYLNVKWVPVQI